MSCVVEEAPTRVYELPMGRGYVKHWGLPEGVRELLQNALDSDSPFEYDFDGDILTITSRFSPLSPRTLLLGCTTKNDRADLIGSFGEGYKLALLALARAGYDVTVFNSDKIWLPVFRMSEVFGEEVFAIEEYPAPENFTGVRFSIAGLDPDEQEALRGSCLGMQPIMDDVIHTRLGRILPSRPGKLFVGGLFVCDTELSYGYDADPEHLTLERDRQTVCGWDLKSLAKDMWFDTGRYADIAVMIEEELPDLAHAEYGCPELVKEACFKLFTKRHPGKIAVKNQAEMDRLVSQGMTKVVYTGSNFHAALSSSTSYQKSMGALVAVKTPEQELKDWLEKHQRSMKLPVRIEFQQLIKKSADWRLK